MSYYNNDNDKLVKNLTTLKEPNGSSKVEVNIRSYSGKNKIALQRFSNDGRHFKLGRLSEIEWEQLCSFIKTGDSGADTGIKLFDED